MTVRVEWLLGNGVTQVNVYCEDLACRHRGTVQLSQFEPKTPLQAIRSRLKYSSCGGRDIDVIPDWSPLQPTQSGYHG